MFNNNNIGMLLRWFAADPTMPRAKRLSGAQREVLQLYRSWLRAIKQKPIENQLEMRAYVREQFKFNARIGLLQVDRIQMLMNKGRKQLQVKFKILLKSLLLF